MPGSALSSLDFAWQIRPAIGPAVNSDNLRIIDPLLFVYKDWPLGERLLSWLGIVDILLCLTSLRAAACRAVLSLASPRRVHYPRWIHGQPDQQHEPIAVLRTCEKPGDAGLRHLLHDYQGAV